MANDHMLLLGFFEKSFANIQNPRLVSLTEKNLYFKFKVVTVPGRLKNGPEYMYRQGGDPTTKDARLYCLHTKSSTSAPSNS